MEDQTFEGFEPANTTPVPDILFDQLLCELNESELKVLLYIIRRTAGFKKPTDAISLTQFQKGIKKRATGEILDRGCGVKDRSTIIKALASLESRGYIQSTKTTDPQGDKGTSTYRIRFRTGVVGKTNHPTDKGSGQNQPPWWANQTTGSGQNQPGVVGDSDLQETVIQLDSKQENILPRNFAKETHGSAVATPITSSDEIIISGHDYQMPHLDVNCALWRRMHSGSSCQDYQAAIDLEGKEPYIPDPVSEAKQSNQLATTTRVSARVEKPKQEDLFPSEEKKAPEMPTENARWCTRTCVQMFDAWRGAPLLVKFQIQQASQCGKTLSQNYTRQQVVDARKYMVEEDEWWSKHPEKVDICTVAKHIHEMQSKMARKSGQQPGVKKPQSELTDFTHWTDSDWDNWQRYGVKPDHARR